MTVRLNDETGKWEAIVSKRHALTGQPMNLKRVGFKNKASALRAEREMKDELAAKAVSSKSVRWSEAVQRCLTAKFEQGYDKHTLHCYESGLNAHTQHWSGKPIDEITRPEIIDLIRNRVSDKKPSHQRNILKYVRTVFNHALDTGIISASPVPQLKLEKMERLEEVLTSSEVKKFLTEAKLCQSEWYSVWTVALYTGMRSGELFALNWENVDIERKLIYVRNTWTKRSGFKEYPKSGKHRVLEIAEPIIPLLKELKLLNQGTGFVLPRLEAWARGEQAAHLRSFLRSIGIKPIRFHALRATWATLLLSNGVPQTLVAKAAGWERLETMDRYVRLSGTDIKGMMDGFVLHDHTMRIADIISGKFGRS